MSTHPGRRSAPGAGLLLRSLLAEYEPYRRQWRRHVLRAGAVEVHQGAVAMVIAEYLWDRGEVDESDDRLPRRLKDPVGRALSGHVLSRRTLEWFIQAFEFTDVHRAQLWEQLRADREPPSPVLDVVRSPVNGAQYRTRALNEHHILGRQGLPLRHVTMQVIEAVEPISHYTYRFDTSAASIEVTRGGRAGRVHPLGAGIFAVDIQFPSELAPGETATMEYQTVFHYDTAPPPEFRRGVRRPVGAMALEVQFHPDRLPRRVDWARWGELGAGPLEREQIALRADHSVHAFRSDVEETICGFMWEW